MDRPDLRFMVMFASVSHVVQRLTQVFCHYETLVRNDLFLQRMKQQSGGQTALLSLRRIITAEFSLLLNALWDAPKNSKDNLDKESIPALLAYALEPDVVEALRQSNAFDGRTFVPERDLSRAYRLCHRVTTSRKFINNKNHRDREYAHRLRQTNSERNGMEFETPTHGDLELLFVLTHWTIRYIEEKIFPASERRGIKALLSFHRANTREMWIEFNQRIDTFKE